MKIFRFQVVVMVVALLGMGLPVLAQNDVMDLEDLLAELAREQDAEEPAPPVDEPDPWTDEIDDIDDPLPEVPVDDDIDDPLPEEPVDEEDVDIDDLWDLLDDPEEPPVEPVEPEEPPVEPIEDPVVEVPEVDEPEDEPVEVVDELPPIEPEVDTEEALLAQMERARLAASEEEGRRKFQEAREAAADGRYREAITKYNEALRLIPVRVATRDMLTDLRRELSSSYLIQGQVQARRGEFTEARESVLNAETQYPGHPEISAVREEIAQLEDERRRIEDRRDPELDAAKERIADAETRIERGIEFFDLGDYNKAQEQFDLALIQNPYNKDAMRYLHRIEQIRERASTEMRKMTVERAMQQVREKWNPPVRAALLDPEALRVQVVQPRREEEEALRRKLETIIIPRVEFVQANIVDVINFLREASEAEDVDEVGVNIILRLDGRRREAAPTTPTRTRPTFDDDLWGMVDDDPAPDAPARTPAVEGVPSITLNLRRVSLGDAIRYVTEVADLRYRLDGNVVIITPRDVVDAPVITRLYPVQPTLPEMIGTGTSPGTDRFGPGTTTGGFMTLDRDRPTAATGADDIKEFFRQAGVPFPEGTSITYNPAISQLIVSNTAENLDIFERILRAIDVVPMQVEIEARFIEVQQSDLEALGFEWLLDDNYEMAVRDGPGSPAGRQRLIMGANRDRGGFTRGLRYFDGETPGGRSSPTSGPMYGAGGILGVSSILTNPELTMVLHAIEQKGGIDLLSAPRVTTRSGVNAQIMVVREISYPTDFDAQVTTIDGGLGLDLVTVVVVPMGFETRETGVILNVTPTVGPDGYTIDLAMAPEVSELVDWIQYGVMTPEGAGYNIPKPVFSSRNVTTSIVIWDGQTVVMGGLMREEITTIDDKIPILGDIPIIGRLFRSTGQYSAKQNLLIFVTARLVDPAGNPIDRPGMDRLERAGRTSPE